MNKNLNNCRGPGIEVENGLWMLLPSILLKRTFLSTEKILAPELSFGTKTAFPNPFSCKK